MAAHAIFASSILTGAFVHLCYFRSNEHHLYPFRYVQFHGLLFVIAVALLPLLAGIPVGQSLKAISQAMLCYLGGLYASLTLYRCILHPVNAFPGPIGAKLSALWLSWQLRSRPAFRMLHDLHCKYGPIVRIGPSDLSIVDPQAVRLIYGQQSSCTKNEFYDMSYPAQSLLSFREKPLHDRRRRVWSTGFSDKALRGYERRIQVYRQKLFDQFMVREGELVNVIKWFSFYAYDVMGDLAFARSFDMLDDNQNHWAIQVLLDGIGPLEYMIPVWLLRLCLGIAVLSKDWWRFGQFCNDRLMHRMKNTPAIPDISASLLASVDCDNPSLNDIGTLGADTRLILTAGSDTSAIALTMVVYQLAQHPEEVLKLRKELAPFTADENGEYTHEQISRLARLNGFINETLRLYPPIPGVIPRKTPPEGMQLGENFIPGNVNVSCPQWVIGRSPAAYVDPESFIPERWFEMPELIKEKSAFAPFTIGSYACIGKSLALMNLRTTTARMVMTFDIQFPAGVDGSLFVDNFREHFSLSIEEMPIVLTRYRPE